MEDSMIRCILKTLLDIERELVVGDERGQAPETLKRITALTESLAIKINREEERQMIENAIKPAEEKMMKVQLITKSDRTVTTKENVKEISKNIFGNPVLIFGNGNRLTLQGHIFDIKVIAE
jgi:hypothetical protein